MERIFKLPIVGTDWIFGCTGMYVILSLKHSTADKLMFWNPNSCGYTPCMFNAGKYTLQDVETNWARFNDGLNAIAIPLTKTALDYFGFFEITVDLKKIDLTKFATRSLKP